MLTNSATDFLSLIQKKKRETNIMAVNYTAGFGDSIDSNYSQESTVLREVLLGNTGVVPAHRLS